MRAPAIAGFLVLGLLGGPLHAFDTSFGGQIGLAQPQSDLAAGKWLTGRGGASAGLYGLIDLGNSHALRARADATFIRPGTINLIDGGGGTQLYAENARTRLLIAGLDYNYFILQHAFEGPYVIMGLGYAWASFTGARIVPGGLDAPPADWPARQSAQSLQYALGMGWRFSPHLGGEFRFTQGAFRDVGVPYTMVKSPILNLGLTLDF